MVNLSLADRIVPATGLIRVYMIGARRYVAQFELPKTATCGCHHLAMVAFVAQGIQDVFVLPYLKNNINYLQQIMDNRSG